jgi:single-strand DNA-binding protein
MINRVVLVGRLTRDPEIRAAGNSGSNVCSFTLAVDNRFNKTSDGQKTADFIPCVVWNRPAEVLAQYARKGSLIGVEGRIQTRNYENKDGNKVYVTEVLCENIQLLESKNSSSGRGQDDYEQVDYSPQNSYQSNSFQRNQPSRNESYEPASSRGIDLKDDDLPF